MNILVIGESCKDVYCYGESNRMCPEAPVPVFNPVDLISSPGMAMNVKRNIECLGIDVTILTNDNWEQVSKTRFVDHRTNYMFMRLDDFYQESRLTLLANRVLASFWILKRYWEIGAIQLTL